MFRGFSWLNLYEKFVLDTKLCMNIDVFRNDCAFYIQNPNICQSQNLRQENQIDLTKFWFFFFFFKK